VVQLLLILQLVLLLLLLFSGHSISNWAVPQR
jgi:hypothetical protein